MPRSWKVLPFPGEDLLKSGSDRPITSLWEASGAEAGDHFIDFGQRPAWGVLPQLITGTTSMPAPRLAGFEHRVIVGIADLAVSNHPSVTLTTYSLGSCLGVAIYDPVVRAGGLLHLMLPDSSIDPARAVKRPGMFADTGIESLLRSAEQLGVDLSRTRVAVAGAAQIIDSSGYFNIGRRNYDSLVQELRKRGLSIDAEQVGGLANRTMFLNLASGEVRLKVSGQSTETILLCGNSTTT